MEAVPEPKPYTAHEIKLIRGTYEAIARLGAQRISLRAIARELEVSPGLLIYHFCSHENLLLETMTWALQSTVSRIRQQIRDVGAGVHDPKAALIALIDAVFIGPHANRDFYLVYLDLVQYAIRQQSFTGLTDLLRQHVNGSYAMIIEAGVKVGVFDVDDIDKAARQARAIVEGAVVQWLQDDDWQTTHSALRDDCEHALLLLLGHHEIESAET